MRKSLEIEVAYKEFGRVGVLGRKGICRLQIVHY